MIALEVAAFLAALGAMAWFAAGKWGRPYLMVLIDGGFAMMAVLGVALGVLGVVRVEAALLYLPAAGGLVPATTTELLEVIS